MSAATVNQDTMLSTETSDSIRLNDSVDFSVLTRLEDVNVEGEPDLVVELIDLYLSDMTTRLKTMRDALLSSDAQSLRDAAHSVKGSSSSLGAFRMATLFNDLEESSDDFTWPGVNSLFHMAEREFECVRLALACERDRRLKKRAL